LTSDNARFPRPGGTDAIVRTDQMATKSSLTPPDAFQIVGVFNRPLAVLRDGISGLDVGVCILLGILLTSQPRS
jgi:hypothetical protein